MAGKGLSPSEIVSAISKDADVRKDVVRDVLDSFINVAIEEIVNKGEFTLPNFFQITEHEWGSYTSGYGFEVPRRLRLKVKLREAVRTLHKKKQEDPDLEVTRENWNEVWHQVSSKFNYSKKKSSKVDDEIPNGLRHKTNGNSQKQEDDYNPILDE